MVFRLGETLPVLGQVALVLAAIALVAILSLFILTLRRPVAATVWFRRKRLARAGFVKTTVPTSAGPQIVWHGGSGPLLVLLHGAGDQAGTWHKTAPDLARKYSLVMPELAGHGESAPPSGPLSIGTILGALDQVLDSAPWKSQSFILAGNSLGAWMAMLYSRTHADRVSRLLLISGGALRSEQAEVTLLPKNREEARKVFDAILDPSSPRPPAFVLDDVVRIAKGGPIARIAAMAADIPGYTLDGKLAGFPVPVDIIWGASDELIPIDYAREMEAQLPAARLTVIERCGHIPQLECPERLLETLHRLLATEPPQSKTAG
ncbi:MAG: alpha/beta hydrolase [Terriglobales bacterium]